MSCRLLLDATAEAVIVVDADGRVGLANEAARQLFGYAEDELNGISVERLIPPRYREQHARHRARFSENPDRRPMCRREEVIALVRDGAEIPVEIGLAPFTFEDAQFTLVTINDVSRRREVEEALRESNQRYRSLFGNMLDGYAHCRMIYREGRAVDFLYLAVNPAFVHMTGLRDVEGKTFTQVIPGATGANPEILANYDKVVRSGEPVRFDTRVDALDAWFSIAAYRTAEGEFVAVFHDISERMRAEEELRKLSLAVAQSPVSIIITGLDACIEYVNPAFTIASGYAAAEVVGRNPSILKSGRTPPSSYKKLWEALHQGRTWRGEFVNRRKDGSEYIEVATISPVRQANGRITHYMAVKEDITELRLVLRNLHAGEERLRLAKNAAGLGIFDRDIASDTLEWDERMREMWGAGPDEPINFGTFLAGVHPDDRAATQAAIGRALDPEGDGGFSAEYRVVSRGGTERVVTATGQAFFDDGRAVRIVGAVKDVTRQKRLEDELRQRRSELETLLEQQVAAQTAAAIAHELNQPLVSISAYNDAALRMLRKGLTTSDKLIHALESSVEQAQRAGRTLHELIDFLHSGDIVATPLDINGVVRDAVAIARDNCRPFRASLYVDADLPPVFGNRLQLQKVLVNLIHNGVEALGDSDEREADIEIAARSLAASHAVQVTVHDNGPGLDAEKAARIFEPFYTSKTTGIGLGLAISRALIEAHGGELWLDFDGNPGATFHFTVPFTK